MIPRYLAIAVLASGCGEVANPVVDARGGGQPDGSRPPDAAMTTPYKGTLAQTQAVAFGGPPYCNYTITLQQLELELDILASGQVTSGRALNLNVEGPPTCPNIIVPTIANYTLQSSTPNGNATKLTFQGAADNAPAASLVVNLARNGSAYSAMLTFHRIDQSPPLDWTVNVTLLLSAQ